MKEMSCDRKIRSASPLELGEHQHICGFFRNAERSIILLLPFIKKKEGIERGEKGLSYR